MLLLRASKSLLEHYRILQNPVEEISIPAASPFLRLDLGFWKKPIPGGEAIMTTRPAGHLVPVKSKTSFRSSITFTKWTNEDSMCSVVRGLTLRKETDQSCRTMNQAGKALLENFPVDFCRDCLLFESSKGCRARENWAQWGEVAERLAASELPSFPLWILVRWCCQDIT